MAATSAVALLMAATWVAIYATSASRGVREGFVTVVANQYSEDVGWLERGIGEGGVDGVVVCTKPGSTHPQDPACPRARRNRGREASAYLAYIVANYDRLPKRVAFLHGHEDAWHQSFPGGILAAIRSADPAHGYVSLNLRSHPGVGVYDLEDRAALGPHTAAGFDALRRRWGTHFQEHLGPLPRRFFHDCRGQFVVSRERIHRHPRRAYERWLALFDDGDDDDDEYALALGFEFVWHYIFGEPAVCEDGAGGRCDAACYLATRFLTRANGT